MTVGTWPALGVAGGSGVGARALGPDLEEAHAVHAGERAASRADLDQLDAGDADRQARALLEAVGARDFELAGEERLAAVDDAGLGRGAAHVEGEQARLAELARHARRGQRSRRRAGLDEADRHALRRLRRRDAAGREHDVEAPGDAQVLELALEVVEVLGHQRHDVDVGAGGRGPLVLADLRHDLGRAGHGHRGQKLDAEVRQRALVDRVAVGVQEADRDGLDARVLEPRDGRAGARLVQRREHAAVGLDALRDLEPQVARHQRRRLVDEEVVHVVAAFAPDLDRVAEARRREEPRPRALALDQRVGGQRGPVDQRADIGGPAARVVQQRDHALLDGLRGVLGGREELADLDGACGVVHPDEVGEGPADVDADARVPPRRCHAPECTRGVGGVKAAWAAKNRARSRAAGTPRPHRLDRAVRPPPQTSALPLRAAEGNSRPAGILGASRAGPRAPGAEARVGRLGEELRQANDGARGPDHAHLEGFDLCRLLPETKKPKILQR